MKLMKWTFTVGMTLFAFAVPVTVAAQDHVMPQPVKHHHYKLIDLGTLGGPSSIVFEQGTRSLNNNGVFAGCGDTPNFDPNNPQNPYFLYPDSVIDPYIQHVFEWKDGRVRDLGALPGATSSCTQWISDTGWNVGGSTNGIFDSLAGYPEVNAALWKSGRIFNLGTLGGNQSLAWSVNDNGQVVGFALTTTPDQFSASLPYVFAFGATEAHAFLWEHGRMKDLGTLGGPDSAALVVNNLDQIAGLSMTNSVIDPNMNQPPIDPFLWEMGRMIDLGTLGGAYGYPNALNNRGQVVGASDVAGDQAFHAFLWEGGSMKDLGTLGGNSSEARWINDAGDIAGWALLPGNPGSHATLWKDGQIIDLGALPGNPCSYANGVDSHGRVYGAVQQCPNNPPRVAFLWENGEMVDLNSLVLPGSDLFLGGAINANDSGEIVAGGNLPNGDSHDALLIPCDENHPNIEGCDYSTVDADAIAQIPTARSTETIVTGTTHEYGDWQNHLRGRQPLRKPSLGAAPTSTR
jgi:probable HAF family extracellular repeat protein